MEELPEKRSHRTRMTPSFAEETKGISLIIGGEDGKRNDPPE